MQVSGIQTRTLPAGTDPRQTSKLVRAASDFEALLISQMLRSARESSGSLPDDDGGSETNSPLMELGEQQFAQALAANGGFGVARMVVVGLSKDANR